MWRSKIPTTKNKEGVGAIHKFIQEMTQVGETTKIT
jgi:hypothetical protein